MAALVIALVSGHPFHPDHWAHLSTAKALTMAKAAYSDRLVDRDEYEDFVGDLLRMRDYR